MAMKYALGICIATFAKNCHAVALTPTMYLDELSRELKMSIFSQSKFSIAAFSEWVNYIWDGRCQAVHIVSTRESGERTQLCCEECTYTQLVLSS